LARAAFLVFSRPSGLWLNILLTLVITISMTAQEVTAVRNTLKSVKARTFIIGPHHRQVYPSGEHADMKEGIKADHHFEGQRLTLFDALYIPSGGQHSMETENGIGITASVNETLSRIETADASVNGTAIGRGIVTVTANGVIGTDETKRIGIGRAGKIAMSISPVNKEIVGASHLTTPGREAPQTPQHSSNLKRAPQHNCDDDLVSFSSCELVLFVLHSKSRF
jgi:hypothetical protein